MTANLEYYKVFYFVVKCGSITLAADTLALSQPAVSQSIKQLERALGVVLFHRTPKGIVPTAEGQLLFSYVEKGYEQFEAGERQLFSLLNLERGEIRIGASDMTLQFFLLPHLEKFHEKYPNIRFLVTNGPTPATMQLLHEGKIDFGVISGPWDAQEGVRQFAVRQIEDIFVTGPRYEYLCDRLQPLKVLEELPLIMLEKNSSTRRNVQRYLDCAGISAEPEFELATSDMIVRFALRSLGVGCVVRDFAKQDLERGTLKEIHFDAEFPKRDILIVTDERKRNSIAAAKLLKMLKGEEENHD